MITFKRIYTFLGLVSLLIITACESSKNNNQIDQKKKNSQPFILDMVHHNPGEEPYKSEYNNPAVIKNMGYNGKVYFLFESPALAITWDSVDPDILPKGSEEREWVDNKATKIKEMHEASKQNGIAIYAMSDLILFPKRLIEKYNIEKQFGNPQDSLVQRLVRAQIDEIFTQFPLMDGLVVRIGETYLHDAPYHQGAIHNKKNADKTIIPLMQLLREEICVKRNKELIFRTWLAFDVNDSTYQKVSDAVDPHEKLTISVKHCEGDFHRANAFSKVIGQGRHKQIIEVQCAREYEGKGAYPNYIANGAIEGFEEHENMPQEAISNIKEFATKKPEMFAGVWTWTRGGGWGGPYIKNEMWCDLNAWVMAQWAKDPTQTEKEVFNQYAKEQLHLSPEDVEKFRKLCLLSAEAVVRGRNSTHRDMSPWWTRDQGIGWPEVNQDADKQNRNLTQKQESVDKWNEIVILAASIEWADDKTSDYVMGSALYGKYLYEIYQSLVHIADAEAKADKMSIQKWITLYDKAWNGYNKLPEEYSSLASLYTQNYSRHIKNPAHIKVDELREVIKLKHHSKLK